MKVCDHPDFNKLYSMNLNLELFGSMWSLDHLKKKQQEAAELKERIHRECKVASDEDLLWV